MPPLQICKRVATALALAVAACGGSGIAPENFNLIAHSLVDGVEFIDTNVRAALAENGQVAFVGIRSMPHGQHAVFVGNGEAAASAVATGAAGYSNIRTVQISSAGELAVIADRSTRTTLLRGVYRTDMLGSQYVTLYEGTALWSSIADGPTPPKNLRMAANGMLAFSTNANGNGGVYRVPAAARPSCCARPAAPTTTSRRSTSTTPAPPACTWSTWIRTKGCAAAC